MNESISILNSVEILPLNQNEVNPFLTKVKIKVFHLGENRNHSYIDRNTAISMAKTLRGNPIVARYREEKGDFTDHGQEIIINDKGINVMSMTKPYGFVDLNAKVWFEDFDDIDPMSGETLRHTYLVTEGMVWTEQYEELKNTVLDGGRPQSMELDEKTLQGNWTDSINPNYDIFIINDAVITKLCALGEDTEPCFIGSSIVPEFNLNEESFVKELLDLKHKFQYALNKNDEGGLSMDILDTSVVEEAPVVEAETVTEKVENFSNEEGNVVETIASEIENNTEEFVKKEDSSSEDKKDDAEDSKPEKEDASEDKSDSDSEEDKEKDKKKVVENTCADDEKNKYELLKADFDELQAKFSSLEEENKKLVAFKQEVEDKQKDEMIASFYMLSDEDKKDVIANKSQYSLDDIKAKLSIICVDKRVDFSLGKTSEETVASEIDEAPVVYNLDAHEADTLPAWLKAVEDVHNRNK